LQPQNGLKQQERRRTAIGRRTLDGEDMTVKPDPTDEDSASTSSEGPAGECEDDRCGGSRPPIWHCVDCDSSYCRYVHLAIARRKTPSSL